MPKKDVCGVMFSYKTAQDVGRARRITVVSLPCTLKPHGSSQPHGDGKFHFEGGEYKLPPISIHV